MKRKYFLIIFLIILMLISVSVFAQLKLPKGLQVIKEYNKEQAKFYLKNLSFVIAFLAGILSVLSPCTIAILPAFFAYSFGERKQITKMTLMFFLGFALIFVFLGLIASYLGKTIVTFQMDNKLIILIAGIFIIIFGIMSLLGKGFTFLKIKRKSKSDALGIFILGLLFALGWTVCIGPIVSAILLIAATFQNYFYSGLLLFFYSVGLFIPLFLISFFLDKYKLLENKWLVGKKFELKILNKKFEIHSTNLISGLLLLFLGILFIFYGGTSLVNRINLFGAKNVSYELQNKILSVGYINIIGIIVLLIFLFVLWRFLRRKK